MRVQSSAAAPVGLVLPRWSTIAVGLIFVSCGSADRSGLYSSGQGAPGSVAGGGKGGGAGSGASGGASGGASSGGGGGSGGAVAMNGAPCDGTLECKAGEVAWCDDAGPACVPDLCADDPCGAGDGRASGCLMTSASSLTCECAGGYASIDDGGGATCSCDLGGTFAMRVERNVAWSFSFGIADGADKLYSWAVRTHTYEPDGTLTMETQPCGETTQSLCDTFLGEAHSQFLPLGLFDRGNVPSDCHGGSCPSMSLPEALPGKPFITPHTAIIYGLTLDDPTGAWPLSLDNVAGGRDAQTNGATWADQDGDGMPGVTFFGVPPGGTGGLAGVIPPKDYGANAASCSGAAYGWWPAAAPTPIGIAIERVKRFHAAQRVLSHLEGTIDSCDRLSGAVRGPDKRGSAEGEMFYEARFASCVSCASGSAVDCPEQECTPGATSFTDGQDQAAQWTTSASFVMVRVPEGTTCADARGLDYGG